MVIQPFVGQHETEHDQFEWGVRFHPVPIRSIEGVAEKFESELVLLGILQTEWYGIEKDRKSDDVPQAEKDSRGLE